MIEAAGTPPSGGDEQKSPSQPLWQKLLQLPLSRITAVADECHPYQAATALASAW
jgi:hypothetical protein